MIVITIIIAWLIVGACGFIFWWTKDFDFTTSQIPVCIAASLMGPISWVFGWALDLIFGDDDDEREPVIIFKQRKP